ncbi:MAG: efflux RND transporter periplasmic adaptor subunit [Deltaproteobacteria bacterium]|nr:efflux RND transporter periplasmic adaptor subunit [Deltaproteobacteria bacterium]
MMQEKSRRPTRSATIERPRTHAWALRAALSLATMLSLSLLGCARSGADPEPSDKQAYSAPLERAPELVEITQIESSTLEVPVTASGSTQARRVSGLGAALSGRIVALYVDVGDRVEAGTALFSLDPMPYQTALDEASAGLALARAEHANALHDERRVEHLADRRAASEARREQLRTAADVAAARVAQMEARLARAENNLERTVIRAPYAGSVVERRAHEGEMAGPDPVVILQESGALVAVLNIPEATLVPVRVGAPLRLHAAGLSAPIETRVDRVSQRVDPQTRTYEIRATVEDPSGTVMAGSYVHAEITATTAEPRPVVARSALLMRDGRSYLFRLEDDGRVHRIPVRVGAVTPQWAEILSGANEGDRVVTGDAVGRLADRDAVRISREGVAQSSTPGAAS